MCVFIKRIDLPKLIDILSVLEFYLCGILMHWLFVRFNILYCGKQGSEWTDFGLAMLLTVNLPPAF